MLSLFLLITSPGASCGAIPRRDPYETGFTTGQRNIFRQAFQKRADASLVKMTNFTERYALKYTFDVYNLTNTASFDIPGQRGFSKPVLRSVPCRGHSRFPHRVHLSRHANQRELLQLP